MHKHRWIYYLNNLTFSPYTLGRALASYEDSTFNGVIGWRPQTVVGAVEFCSQQKKQNQMCLGLLAAVVNDFQNKVFQNLCWRSPFLSVWAPPLLMMLLMSAADCDDIIVVRRRRRLIAIPYFRHQTFVANYVSLIFFDWNTIPIELI